MSTSLETKTYIFQILRRYDMKPEAHQFCPQFCRVIGYRIFQNDVVLQNLATVGILVIYLKKRQVIFDVLKK